MNTKEKLLNILREFKSDVDFTTESGLFEKGIFTSFDILKLVMTINTEFDVEITPLDVTMQNFYSLDTIAHLIDEKEDE